MAELTPPAAPALTIERSVEASGTPLLALTGELDSANVALLDEAVAAVIAQRPRRVIFDLAELRFMDSAGIAVLITTSAHADTVEVRNPSAILRRVLETMGVDTILQIRP